MRNITEFLILLMPTYNKPVVMSKIYFTGLLTETYHTAFMV